MLKILPFISIMIIPSNKLVRIISVVYHLRMREFLVWVEKQLKIGYKYNWPYPEVWEILL